MNPFEETILLSLSISQMGNTRKVGTENIEVEADKDMLRVSKKLLDCEEFKKITSITTDLKAFIKRKSLPAKFIKRGVYPIPVPFVNKVEAQCRESQRDFEEAVEAFLEVYPERIKEAVTRLNVLGTELDYPSLEDAKKCFSLTWEYVTMGPPAQLEKINKEIWDKEREKAELACKEEAQEVIKSFRFFFQESLEHMIEKLTPDPDGGRKVLKEARVKAFQEFLQDFSLLNVCQDVELAKLVEKTKAFMQGRNRENIKERQELIREKLTEIKREVDSVVIKAPIRAIRLKDLVTV